MTFSPLRDGEASELERLILDSARGDAPGAGVRAQTLAALGISSGVALAASGTARAATQAFAGGVGGKGAASATGATLAKWLLAGALAGAATTSGVIVATNPELVGFGEAQPAADRARSKVEPVRPRGVEHALGRRETPLVASPPELAASPSPAAVAQPSAARFRSAPGDDTAPGDLSAAPFGTAFPVPGTETVAEEVAALDQVRGALSAGNARGALARLDAYDQRYPRGTLSPEATVLRVRALVQIGRQRDAAAVVDRFVRAHPASSQAVRLRALVGERAP